MFHTFVICCLCCCCVLGVFGDAVKSVSVKEGDSVTLQTNVTKIQTGDEIMWTFGTNRNLIAKISGEISEIVDGPDGRFRDRLKLDHQTGSLTITDTRAEHAGVYKVEISRRSSATEIRFIVSVYDVFGLDAVKLVSVKEGDSVTLQINVTEIQTGDEITWTFGTNRNLIAKISGETSDMDDGPDGRFRDRLKLDHQTGSLTIMNTRTEHAGVYKVEISRRSSEIEIRFNVTVYDSGFCCHFAEAVSRLVISALVGVAALFIVVYDITSRKAEQERS